MLPVVSILNLIWLAQAEAGDIYLTYESNDPSKVIEEPPHPAIDAPRAVDYYTGIPPNQDLFSIASGQPCRSSSAYETDFHDPWDCGRALDGYSEICFGSEPNDVVPWWRVDLEESIGVAQIEIYTTDEWGFDAPGSVDVFVGNEDDTWMTSIKCAVDVSVAPLFVAGTENTTKEPAPIKISCNVAGRYVWIVGQKNKRLIMCEVKTRVRGPDGFKVVPAVVGNMFDVDLTGIQFSDYDRITIVDSTIPCGSEYSNIMDDSVVLVSSPDGPADYIDTEDQSSASWRNIRMKRMGFYRICWCGEACDLGGQYFNREGGIVVVNGILRSPIGDPFAFGVGNKISAQTAKLDTPTCVSTHGSYLFICEKGRVRYVDLNSGVIDTLVGQMGNQDTDSVRFIYFHVFNY